MEERKKAQVVLLGHSQVWYFGVSDREGVTRQAGRNGRGTRQGRRGRTREPQNSTTRVEGHAGPVWMRWAERQRQEVL